MEQVHITAVGNNTNVPMWATEKTQAAILKALEDHFDVSEKMATDLKKSIEKIAKDEKKDRDDQDRELERVVKALEGTQRTTEEQRNRRERTSSNAGSSGGIDYGRELRNHRQRTSHGGESGNNAGRRRSAEKKRLVLLKETNKALKEFSDNLVAFPDKVVGILGNLTSLFQKQGDLYLETYRSGVNLNTTLEGLADEASIAQMSIEDYSNVLRNNALVVNRYGRKEFVRTMSRMGKSMEKFGYLSNEAATYFGDYLETQRLMGVFNEMDSKRQEANAKRNMIIADNFAQALGKSREEVLKSMETTSQDTIARMSLWGLSKEEIQKRREYNNMFSMLSGEEFNNMSEHIQRGSEYIVKNKDFQAMAVLGQKDFVDKLAALSKEYDKNEISPEEMGKMYKEMVMSLKPTPEMKKTLDAALEGNSSILDKSTAEFVNSVIATQQMAEGVDIGKLMNEQKEIDKQADQLATFNNTISSLQSRLISVFNSVFTADMVETISNGLGRIQEMFEGDTGDKLRKSINELVDSWVPAIKDMIDEGVPLIKNVTGFITNMNDFFASFQNPLVFLGSMAAAYATIKTIPTILGSLVKVFGKALWGITKDLFGKLRNVAGSGGIVSKFGRLFMAFIKKLPIIGTIVTGGLGAFEGWKKYEGDLGSQIKAAGAGIIAGIGEFLIGLPAYVVDTIFGTDIQGFVDALADDFVDGVVKKGLGGIIRDVGTYMEKNDTFYIGEELNWLSDKLATGLEIFGFGVMNTLKTINEDGVAGAWDKFTNYIYNDMLPFYDKMLSGNAVYDSISSFVSGISDFFGNLKVHLYSSLSKLPLIGDTFAEWAQEAADEIEKQKTQPEKNTSQTVDSQATGKAQIEKPVPQTVDALGAGISGRVLSDADYDAKYGVRPPAKKDKQNEVESDASKDKELTDNTSNQSPNMPQSPEINTYTMEELLRKMITLQEQNNRLVGRIDPSMGY